MKRESPTPNKLSRRGFLKLSLATLFETLVLIGGGVSYASLIEPGWEETEYLSLNLPRLHPAFNGYRIVQISDIHIGPWMNQERLFKIVEIVNQLVPDLIVITGDFVYWSSEDYANDLISPLQNLISTDGTFAILGNHDYWANASLVREVIQASNIIELRNAFHTLERNLAPLHIAGVDDYWERKDRLDLVLDTLPKEGAAILLAHEPDFADISARTGRFDLQLSGHSHGGQVVIPFFGPPILPLHARKYPSGLYQVRDMLQYTNRGVGMIPPTFRFNCRPEITVFTLLSPSV